MSAYADSSFIVSLVVPDANTVTALRVMEVLPQALPFSELHALEVRNAVRRRVFTGHVSAAQAEAALASLEKHEALLAVRVPAWSAAFKAAESASARLTSRAGLRSLDALHLGLAQSLSSLVFLTFDKRQAAAAVEMGLACPILL